MTTRDVAHLTRTCHHSAVRTLDLYLFEECEASAFFESHQTGRLQEVALYNAMFKDTSLSFPAVHALRTCPARFPSDIDALTRMFPNVVFQFPRECGSLDAKYWHWRGLRWHLRYVGMGWTDPAHTSVQEVRAQILTRPQKKADAWPHIQSLRALGLESGNLMWLGLTCEVPRLEVSSWRMKTTQLACVLNELRVRCLVLHPGTHHGFSNNQSATGMGLLLALRSAPTVTRLAVVLCRASLRYSSAPAWMDTFSSNLGKSSLSCILVRAGSDYPVNKKFLDLIETWREAMASKIISLRIFLFQVDDRVPLGWVKKERAEGGWKEMTDDETRKLVASESICPAVIEPCERCESAQSRHHPSL